MSLASKNRFTTFIIFTFFIACACFFIFANPSLAFAGEHHSASELSSSSSIYAASVASDEDQDASANNVASANQAAGQSSVSSSNSSGSNDSNNLNESSNSSDADDSSGSGDSSSGSDSSDSSGSGNSGDSSGSGNDSSDSSGDGSSSDSDNPDSNDSSDSSGNDNQNQNDSSQDNQNATEKQPAGGERVLEDGHIYIIYSGVSSSKSMEVSGGSLKEGAAICQYTTNNMTPQQWRVGYDKNNYVTFTNIKSGRALCVADTSAYSKGSVQQKTATASLAEKWIVTKVSGKYFCIASALDPNIVLDIYNGSTENNVKIWLFKSNNSKAQKWEFYDIALARENIKELLLAGKEALPAGMYTIVSALSNKALDVAEGSTSAGANVQVWSQNNAFAQKWRISYDSDGYATINAVVSGLNLDVENGIAGNGTNVRQWTCNTAKAQKWIIVPNEDGTFTIVSAIFPNMVLDIYNGSTKDGANVNLWRSNSSNAQKWTFTKTEVYINTGIYSIKTKVNTARALDLNAASDDDNARIQIWDYNKTNAQKWYIKKSDDNTYTIQSTSSGKYLTSKSDGSLYQHTKVSGNSQVWTVNFFVGYYVFKSKLTGKFLDLAAGLDANGTVVQTWTGNGAKAQRWKVTGVAPIEAGTYFIATMLDTSRVIGAAYGNWSPGTNVDLGVNGDGGTQKWNVIRNSDGHTYTFINAASLNALDVAYGSATSGANVQLWSENASDAQKWHIGWNSDKGCFYIASHLNTSLRLDVSGGVAGDGTNIQIYSKNTSLAQGWKFIVTSYTRPPVRGDFLQGIDIASWEAGIDIYAVDADFIIVKVSQGTSYINPYWWDWAWAVLQSGKKLGLYHYAGGNDAVAEADYFVDQIGAFIGRAVLVIDWEAEQNSAYSASGEWWTGAWRARVKERTGISAWTYVSQSISSNFAGPLWIAQYPNYDETGYLDNPWNEGAYSCICRQYTSSGKISGYGGRLDLNKFYGNASEWDAWASGQRS